jgi:hypothetical protein
VCDRYRYWWESDSSRRGEGFAEVKADLMRSKNLRDIGTPLNRAHYEVCASLLVGGLVPVSLASKLANPTSFNVKEVDPDASVAPTGIVMRA